MGAKTIHHVADTDTIFWIGEDETPAGTGVSKKCCGGRKHAWLLFQEP